MPHTSLHLPEGLASFQQVSCTKQLLLKPCGLLRNCEIKTQKPGQIYKSTK